MKAFEDLTESADALLSNGDTDAYSKRKEEFVHELESLKQKSLLNSSGKCLTLTSNPVLYLFFSRHVC